MEIRIVVTVTLTSPHIDISHICRCKYVALKQTVLKHMVHGLNMYFSAQGSYHSPALSSSDFTDGVSNINTYMILFYYYTVNIC